MLSKEENENLLEGVDYGVGESKSITNFLETECPKCNHKIEFRLAIKDIKNVEEYIEQLETKEQKLIEKLEEDKADLTEELRFDITKSEAKIQLKSINKYLEILKGEKE